MRLLLDTNVVFSALLWRGAAYELLAMLREHPEVRLFTSNVLLDELAEVLTRPNATKQLAQIELSAREIVADYLALVELVQPAPLDGSPNDHLPPRVVPRDADDDHVVAAALAANVDAIITGDSDLLSVGVFGSVKVLTVTNIRDQLKS
jgi:uncharacterized protein